jgi:hypothetical protein
MNILPSFKQQHEAFEAKHGNSRIALKLNKSLYGLKQAPRNWYKLLTSVLKGLKLEENQKDPCVYFNVRKLIYLAIYIC